MRGYITCRKWKEDDVTTTGGRQPPQPTVDKDIDKRGDSGQLETGMNQVETQADLKADTRQSMGEGHDHQHQSQHHHHQAQGGDDQRDDHHHQSQHLHHLPREEMEIKLYLQHALIGCLAL